MNCEERNYQSDSRVRALHGHWWVTLDNKRMVAIAVNEEEILFSYEVCPTCNGKGTHVNPSIDASGLTYEDFVEDPDLREEYMSGMYDVPCYGCDGQKVVPVPNDKEYFKEDEEFRQIQESERRYGA